jgi:MSHA biogenesis protein MshP
MCRNQLHSPVTHRHRGANDHNYANRQYGFSLPMAIFILVVVSILAAAIYRMSAINHNSVVQEAMSTRAFLAAESGANAQMMRLFPINGSSLCAAQSQTLTPTGLNGCTIASNCTSLIVNGQTFYHVESIGRCVVAGVSAQRIIEVQAKAP